MFFLISSNNGRIYKLSAGTYTVGRSESCDVVMNDTCVSRQHARISITLKKKKNYVFIKDLGSTNGTTINNYIIKSTKRLRFGDRIKFGNEEDFIIATSEHVAIERLREESAYVKKINFSLYDV